MRIINLQISEDFSTKKIFSINSNFRWHERANIYEIPLRFFLPIKLTKQEVLSPIFWGQKRRRIMKLFFRISRRAHVLFLSFVYLRNFFSFICIYTNSVVNKTTKSRKLLKARLKMKMKWAPLLNQLEFWWEKKTNLSAQFVGSFDRKTSKNFWTHLPQVQLKRDKN